MNDRWIRKSNVSETIWMIDELGNVMYGEIWMIDELEEVMWVKYEW